MSCCHKEPCCCGNKLEATNVIVVGGVMDITVIPTEQFIDYKVYTLELCNALPPHTGVETVTITAGGQVYPVEDRAGNNLHCGRLRGHHRYRMVFGSDPSHFLIFNGLCPMQFSATSALQIDPFSIDD